MNLKILHFIYFAGVFLLITFSSLFAEEKKIPLDASERKLLEQSRIEVPSHYIQAHDFEGEMASGKKASLADFSGKFLILNFWAQKLRIRNLPLKSARLAFFPEAISPSKSWAWI